MRVEGGVGEWASTISAGKMKGHKQIFMFTANISLKTKKKYKKKKAFQNIQAARTKGKITPSNQ